MTLPIFSTGCEVCGQPIPPPLKPGKPPRTVCSYWCHLKQIGTPGIYGESK